MLEGSSDIVAVASKVRLIKYEALGLGEDYDFSGDNQYT
jgi:hypothetical protein